MGAAEATALRGRGRFRRFPASAIASRRPAEAQRPYACLQMTDSGLSARQPPYRRPSAHRSFVFFGTDLPTSGTLTRGG